jgi:polyisoprenoid-binding protein YceI
MDWVYRRKSMVNGKLRAALLSISVTGIAYLLVSMSMVGSRQPATSVMLSPGPGIEAYAQSPGAQVRYNVVADRSEARYRIREQLAGINFPSDAVGSTRAIDGGIVLDAQGRVVTGNSRLTVDLRTLQSDRDRRDNYVRRNTLETDRFPMVVFVPSEVRGLSSPLPQTGTASFELVGDLTVRNVTRPLRWEAMATFNGSEVSVQAKTAFRFGDFDLSIPRVASVLSVDDNIRLEADLLLRRGS